MNQVALPLPPRSITIVLADDHELVRAGIRALLVRVPGVDIVAEARNGNELIAAVDLFQPDIVMTDISMPGMDGLTALAHLHQRHPEVRLVVVSRHDTVDFIRRAVAAGACGYLTKDASPAELFQTVTSVMASGSYFSSVVALRLLRPPEPLVDEDLTVRQIQILVMLAQGKASKEIAHELGLSSKTVDAHRSRIMDRLDLHDLSSLTRFAIRNQLIDA